MPVSLPPTPHGEDDMAKIDGLFQRGGRWYLRVVIPIDLARTVLSGEDEVRRSGKVVLALETADRKKAVIEATIKRAYWLAKFAQTRRERNLTPVECVSPELAEQLAAMVRAAVL